MKSVIVAILCLVAGAVAQQSDSKDGKTVQPQPDQTKYVVYSVLEKAQANIVEKAAKKRVARVEKLLHEAYKLQERLDAIRAELARPENHEGIAEVVKVAPGK